MPVKNTKRRTNDGLEGVITGLTEEEKKVLEDAGIGGGGGGNYNVEVKGVRSDSITDGSYSNYWGLQANTAYEIGDIVSYSKSKRCSPKKLNSNQILVPVKLRASIADNKKTLKFGDVILVLTYVEIKGSFARSSDNSYQLFTDTTLSYTVIKAGTTGSDVALNSSGVDEICQCMVYTLGVTKAAE